MRSLSNIFKTFAITVKFFRVSQIIRYHGMMSNAYLRYEEGSDRFNFSFNLEYKHVNRQFNFNRSISETINDFVSRISTNISKALDKKKKKEKGQCETSGINSDGLVKLLKDGVPLPSDTKCREIIREDGLQLIVCEKLYGIVLNPPWVHSLVLPDSILADFPVYPSKIELEFATRDVSNFTWFRSADDKRNQFSWSPIGEGFFYTPTSNDIGSRLMLACTPRTKGAEDEDTYREGPKMEAISPTVVEAGPGVCPFEVRHAFTSERTSEGSFRVVSYNILADTYVDSDFSRNVLYPYCPPYALAINYRKQLLLKELIGYNADLMCLQEVDAKVFEFDLTPVLTSLGFKGVFQRKGEGKVNEGLACFFHNSKFKLVLSSSILLGKEISTNPIFFEMHEHILTSCADPSRFLAQVCDLPTTLQVTVLEVIEKGKAFGKRIVVAATHLYFHPLADNIRLLQTGMCLKYLEHMIEQMSKDSRATLVFCGDFNSTPEFGVVRLMTCGKVNEDDPDWSSGKSIADEKKAGDNEDDVAKSMDGSLITVGMNLSHPFSLSSAYGEVPFTNYTSGFVGCLDYIFYSTDALTVEQVVPLPSEEEVAQNIAIPSIVFPSDHLAIIADLRWNSCLNI